MDPSDSHEKTGRSGGMEDILLEREQLDQVLKDRFRRDVTILFSDLCGYTEYIDQKGDIDGRSLLLRHNRMVLPEIEEHGGRVIEIVGDGVMAAFVDPLDALKAAAAIQKKLMAHNAQTDAEDEIHVKIGINTGRVLVDENASFQGLSGDVANVAARIQARADQDEIIVTKPVFERVCSSEDVVCRFYGEFSIKGKTDVQTLYRVLWKETDLVVDAEPRVRLYPTVGPKRDDAARSVFFLDLTVEETGLKISSYESVSGDESTLRHYEKVPVSIDEVEARCHNLKDLLNKANRSGTVSTEVLLRVREIGRIFYDELLTLTVKEKLKSTQAETLILSIDDQLVHIPWELLNDGEQFLCLRFSMGRVVKTHQRFSTGRSRALAPPLKMLILADPTGDLKGAYQEGTQIRDFLDQNQSVIHASLRSDHVTSDSIRAKLRNFDLIHFAGHADYRAAEPNQSGWRLSDGRLTTRDIVNMTGTSAMPAMIFANACQSGWTEKAVVKESFETEIFGLANAFLLAGVKHYLGTFWEILDDPSSRFALELYRNLFADMTIGEAVRQARLKLIEFYGEQNIVWAGYVLYGDPTYDYMDQVRSVRGAHDKRQEDVAHRAAAGGAYEEVFDFGKQQAHRAKRSWWIIAGLMTLLVPVLIWAHSWYLQKGFENRERSATNYFLTGEYDAAAAICEELQSDAPHRPAGNLILGNIELARGKMELAQAYFQKALQNAGSRTALQARALVGLGRLSSIDNQPQPALQYYQKAAQADPRNVQAVVSQAILMERGGDYPGALQLYQQAANLAPDDPGIRAAAHALRSRLLWEQSREQRDRIDKLVEELLNSYSGSAAGPPSDAWTSSPLTLWLMDFRTAGFGLAEGEDYLVHSALAAELMEMSQARIVERALLDHLMEELKVGSSKLVEPSTALTLGRILAARAILSGSLVHSGSSTQASVRLIETETGLIQAVVNEVFEGPVSPADIADKLARILVQQLAVNYPLRGKITTIENGILTLNIGREHGVQIGRQFEGADTDIAVEIIAVEPTQSKARLIKGGEAAVPGLRLTAVPKETSGP